MLCCARVACDLDTLAKIQYPSKWHSSTTLRYKYKYIYIREWQYSRYFRSSQHKRARRCVRTTRFVKTAARMGTSEPAIKKPSLAGGHWQRVGRAAFLCASAPHALLRPHAPARSVHTVTRPTNEGPGLRLAAAALRANVIRSERGGTARHTYRTRSLITRPTVSRLPASASHTPPPFKLELYSHGALAYTMHYYNYLD